MNSNKYQQEINDCIKIIRDIDFKKLSISEYNLEYINRLLPHLEYYFKIYADTLSHLIKKEKPDGLIVDYGGGHGFLSLFLKKVGFRVIYCDYNPLSVHTIRQIKKAAGLGPDFITEGSNADLLAFCTKNKLKPTHLISTDVIEHIYDLDLFFAHMFQINPQFQMIFTTGSNPCNPMRTKRLKTSMKNIEQKLFLPMRFEHIHNKYIDLSYDTAFLLAKQTRGLIHKDIDEVVEEYLKFNQISYRPSDKYNTCDPQSGNWMERILSLKKYRQIINKNGFKVTFKKGFYNDERNNIYLSFLVKALNFFILHSGSSGRIPASYLIIKTEPIK